MDKIAVELTKVSKKFILNPGGPNLAKSTFLTKGGEEFWALKNVDLTIRQGDQVGIIGPNGAGKTTLLKAIAGITEPSGGTVKTWGKLVSLINLDAGFHAELTGEENIYLNGMLVGMTKSEIKKRYRQIIKFADIGQFIYMPFYTYSSGMKFRLASSIALASQCEILIIDEVIVSGDFAFQQKTLKAILEIQKKTNITTIICSHVPAFVWILSDIFYELNHGRIKTIKAKKVVEAVEEERRMWTQNLAKSSAKKTVEPFSRLPKLKG